MKVIKKAASIVNLWKNQSPALAVVNFDSSSTDTLTGKMCVKYDFIGITWKVESALRPDPIFSMDLFSIVFDTLQQVHCIVHLDIPSCSISWKILMSRYVLSLPCVSRYAETVCTYRILLHAYYLTRSTHPHLTRKQTKNSNTCTRI